MNLRTIAGVVILTVVVVAGWCYITTAREVPKQLAVTANSNPAAAPRPSPISATQTLTVRPGNVETVPVELPTIPGRLYGSWESKGVSAQLSNALDDTLVAFKLIGPNNEPLTSLDFPTAGSFDIRITSPGTYLFVLDNSGLLRMGAREVHINATYQPE